MINVRELASVLKDANLSASCIDKKYQRCSLDVKVRDAERISESINR